MCVYEVCLWVTGAPAVSEALAVQENIPGLPIIPRPPPQKRQHLRQAGPAVSPINATLQAILDALHENQVETGKNLIETLQAQLKVTTGHSSRDRKGGVQYDPMYILDSILLADNLKPLGGVGEADLLADVVRQWGS